MALTCDQTVPGARPRPELHIRPLCSRQTKQTVSCLRPSESLYGQMTHPRRPDLAWRSGGDLCSFVMVCSGNKLAFVI